MLLLLNVITDIFRVKKRCAVLAKLTGDEAREAGDSVKAWAPAPGSEFQNSIEPVKRATAFK